MTEDEAIEIVRRTLSGPHSLPEMKPGDYTFAIAKAVGVTPAAISALAVRMYRTTTLTSDQWKAVFVKAVFVKADMLKAKHVAREEEADRREWLNKLHSLPPQLSAPRKIEIDPGPV